MNGQLPKKQNAEKQAILFSLERKLLNGEDTEVCRLETMPYSDILHSPLLLKAYGERLLKLGRLPEAKTVLSDALKGLAAHTLQRQLQEAFSALAVVYLRMGEIYEAETILRFLKEQYDRGEEPLTGHVPFALARGAYLWDASAEASRYFTDAFERFRRDGQTGYCCEVVLELAVRFPLSELKGEFTGFAGMLLYLKQMNMQGYLAYIRALHSFHEGETLQVAQYLEEAAEGQYDYHHDTVLKIMKLTATIQAGQPASEARLRQVWELCCVWETDLHLQFYYEQMMCEHHLSLGQGLQAEERLNQAKAIYSLSGSPLQKRTVNHLERKILDYATRNQHEPAPWRVFLFDKLRFVQGGREISGISWKRKKAQGLLIYLLLQPDYCVPRDQALEVLFGEGDPDKLSNKLYVVIHQTRKVLQENLGIKAAILLKDGFVRLREQVVEYVDAEQYVTLVRVGDQLWISDRQLSLELYEKAVTLFGNLIPEVSYSDWLDSIREHFMERQARILKRLGQSAADRQDFERAEAFFSEWIRLRPHQEEAYQAMIRLCADLGRSVEAAAWYHKWEQICREELSIPSLTET